MSELVEWLTQILDEDEQVASQTGQPDGYYPEPFESGDPRHHEVVLADIAAKRVIIALHTGTHACTELRTGTYSDDWPETASWGKAGERWQHASNEHFGEDEPCPTLRQLASAYADRPGYDQEWKP